MLGPEVTEGPDGDRLGEKNTELIAKLLTFDAVVVAAGEEPLHGLTIDDLLEEEVAGERLAERTYLLEDCTSPVVVPGVVDYTDEAGRRLRALRGRGHACRSFDRTDRELAGPGSGRPEEASLEMTNSADDRSTPLAAGSEAPEFELPCKPARPLRSPTCGVSP